MGKDIGIEIGMQIGGRIELSSGELDFSMGYLCGEVVHD